MANKSPYSVILSRYVTEKSSTLQNLHLAESNKSLRKCDQPRYVFLVDKKANKTEIRMAFEAIYKEKKVTVKAVNTLNVKPKERRIRGRIGFKPGFKKAIITLAAGDTIDDQV
jgi:large subunit ribosomal protein L23